MCIPSLQKAADNAARRHDWLALRVREEAGTAGISKLRVKLAQAAQDRIKAENALHAAKQMAAV